MSEGSLFWTECLDCDKTVYVIAGRIQEHTKSPHARKWPKMREHCPRSGKPFKHVLEVDPDPTF